LFDSNAANANRKCTPHFISSKSRGSLPQGHEMTAKTLDDAITQNHAALDTMLKEQHRLRGSAL
jgi:hypothetical protein